MNGVSDIFFQAVTGALVRAERDGRVPPRFTGTGKAVWNTFRNELTRADLVALCVEDAGAAMPIPFAPSIWWPDWPEQAHQDLSPSDAEKWIEASLPLAEQPRDSYLGQQAALLGIELPAENVLSDFPTPLRHEQWLELPGTGGWLAYSLCNRPGSALYLWENFVIVCNTPQEMLLAGLIAWELGAPPHMELPIVLDDADLSATLKAGRTYHAVIGQKRLHGHRDLRILQNEGKRPLWI